MMKINIFLVGIITFLFWFTSAIANEESKIIKDLNYFEVQNNDSSNFKLDESLFCNPTTETNNKSDFPIIVSQAQEYCCCKNFNGGDCCGYAPSCGGGIGGCSCQGASWKP